MIQSGAAEGAFFAAPCLSCFQHCMTDPAILVCTLPCIDYLYQPPRGMVSPGQIAAHLFPHGPPAPCVIIYSIAGERQPGALLIHHIASYKYSKLRAAQMQNMVQLVSVLLSPTA